MCSGGSGRYFAHEKRGEGRSSSHLAISLDIPARGERGGGGGGGEKNDNICSCAPPLSFAPPKSTKRNGTTPELNRSSRERRSFLKVGYRAYVYPTFNCAVQKHFLRYEPSFAKRRLSPLFLDIEVSFYRLRGNIYSKRQIFSARSIRKSVTLRRLYKHDATGTKMYA